MYKNFKTSIFGVLLISIMLFLIACSPSEATIEEPTYQINYLTDGGSTIPHQTYVEGDTIILPDAPTKTGYTFLGWDSQVPEKMPANDITLKALWNAKTYTLNFNTDGGSVIETITLAYEASIDHIPSPTKVGHTFIGWDKPIPEKMPNEDITLKALWEVNNYTITFDTEGGSTIPSQTLAYHEPISTPEDPVKDGYNFVGWDADLPDLMPAENITLRAAWEKIIVESDETFTENFESLQSIKDSGENSSEYLDYDYIGQSYVRWELVNARIDLGMKQGGNAITLGGFGNDYTEAGMGRIYAENIHDGISYLHFDARLPFSPKSTYPQGPGKDKAQNVLIKVFINLRWKMPSVPAGTWPRSR